MLNILPLRAAEYDGKKARIMFALIILLCSQPMMDSLFAQGQISFRDGQRDLEVGIRPTSIAVGDFNGDGIADLAVTNEGSNTVSILLGMGDGRFAAGSTVAVGRGPQSVTVGDFNGDEIMDLAVANFLSIDVSILLGMGNGEFQAIGDFAVVKNPRSVSVGDFNGDGFVDLVVANTGTYPSPGTSVSILLGMGDGQFQAAENFSVGISPWSVSVGDFNGDAIMDLATANFGYPMYPSTTVSILLGMGDGRFATAVSFRVGRGPDSVTADDFNGDAIMDLAVANFYSHTVSILLGMGDGQFMAAQDVMVGMGPISVVVDDFNGDEIADLAVANNFSDTVSVLLGAGDGRFAPAQDFGVGHFPWSVTVGDFNNDGITDLAVANWGSNSVSILLGKGDGTFE